MRLRQLKVLLSIVNQSRSSNKNLQFVEEPLYWHYYNVAHYFGIVLLNSMLFIVLMTTHS